MQGLLGAVGGLPQRAIGEVSVNADAALLQQTDLQAKTALKHFIDPCNAPNSGTVYLQLLITFVAAYATPKWCCYAMICCSICSLYLIEMRVGKSACVPKKACFLSAHLHAISR